MILYLVIFFGLILMIILFIWSIKKKMSKVHIILEGSAIVIAFLFLLYSIYIGYSNLIVNNYLKETVIDIQTTTQKSFNLNVSYNNSEKELMVLLTGAYDIKYIQPNRIYLVINGIQYGYKGFQSKMYNLDSSNNDTIYRFSTRLFDSSAQRSLEAKRKAELIIDFDNGIANGAVKYLNYETGKSEEGN